MVQTHSRRKTVLHVRYGLVYVTEKNPLLWGFALFSVHSLILKVQFMCSHIVGEVSEKVSVVGASLFIINTNPDSP